MKTVCRQGNLDMLICYIQENEHIVILVSATITYTLREDGNAQGRQQQQQPLPRFPQTDREDAD